MRLDDVRRLQQRKDRDELGHLLVEGEHRRLELAKAALREPALLQSRFLVTPERAHWHSPFATQVVSPRQLAKTVDTQTPRGRRRRAGDPSRDGHGTHDVISVRRPGGHQALRCRTLRPTGGRRHCRRPGNGPGRRASGRRSLAAMGAARGQQVLARLAGLSRFRGVGPGRIRLARRRLIGPTGVRAPGLRLVGEAAGGLAGLRSGLEGPLGTRVAPGGRAVGAGGQDDHFGIGRRGDRLGEAGRGGLGDLELGFVVEDADRADLGLGHLPRRQISGRIHFGSALRWRPTLRRNQTPSPSDSTKPRSVRDFGRRRVRAAGAALRVAHAARRRRGLQVRAGRARSRPIRAAASCSAVTVSAIWRASFCRLRRSLRSATGCCSRRWRSCARISSAVGGPAQVARRCWRTANSRFGAAALDVRHEQHGRALLAGAAGAARAVEQRRPCWSAGRRG